MSKWLMEKTSSLLESRSDRRRFLVRAAYAGSALSVAPARYILRPGTAYAAICSCANASCDCASSCCDGYTEFCCTLNGSNSCPPGTFAGGWWKADGTAFCSADRSAPRYYIDCNLLPGAACACQCGGASCSNRRACCNRFRYGQCHQEIAGVTAIACRVVTCTPPWQFDSTCTTASAVDQATAAHDAACLRPPPLPRIPAARPAIFRGNTWYLKNNLGPGGADIVFQYGDAGDRPIMGDWNGDGTKTPGVVRGNTWYLKNSLGPGRADVVFQYGDAGDIPVVGDWNGDGRDTPGVVRGNWWFLKNSLGAGNADVAFQYGNAGDIPIVGDWNRDGRDTPGVVRAGRWYLKNSLGTGNADNVFQYGNPGDRPIVGDWNADGRDTPGVVRGNFWYLRQTNTAGAADVAFQYGDAGDIPRVWSRL